MTDLEIQQTEATLKSLRDVELSPGWSYLRKVMHDDLLAACFQISDNPLMTEKEIDFRRGAISAARNFLNVIPILTAKLESDLLLASVENQTQTPLNATAFPRNYHGNTAQ